LRIDDLRVFYEVEEGAGVVRVLAVGRKRGNALWLAGKEVVL
jgi:mRNA-degrading endonuclease RelE of RelBE toxin-antitoxin system